MSDDTHSSEHSTPHSNRPRRESRGGPRGGTGDAVYAFGLVGALVFYWQHASTFGGHVLAILKSLVWPALLVYDALKGLRG